MDRDDEAPGYAVSLDRAGLALGAGALLGGAFAAALVAVDQAADPQALLSGFVIGAGITPVAAVAVGGPPWLLCHALGRRGPGTALWVGWISGFALFLAGQTYDFGLSPMPPSDSATLLFRWISATATSLLLSLATSAIALTMWRVAYRRLR